MIRKKEWGKAFLGLFTPIYWVMMSLATVNAVVQLIIKPHHWDKTKHGLTGGNKLVQNYVGLFLIILRTIFVGLGVSKTYSLSKSNTLVNKDGLLLTERKDDEIPVLTPSAVLWVQGTTYDKNDSIWNFYKQMMISNHITEYTERTINGLKNLTLLKNNIKFQNGKYISPLSESVYAFFS